MHFTKELLNSADKSEVDMFRKLVAKLMSFQKTQEPGYYDEKL